MDVAKSLIDELQRAIISLLHKLAIEERSTLPTKDDEAVVTPIPGVTLLKVSENIPRVPVFYEPSIVFVAQGRKRGYLGKHTFQYDPNTYLVLSAPLPFECETEASPENPLLAVYVRIRKEIIAELLTNLPQELDDLPDDTSHNIAATPLDLRLSGSLLRLLDAMQSENDARILGPQIVKEILYRVLTGPQGFNLRAMLGFDGHFSQITRVLNQIHNNYAKSWSVAQMAQGAGMSPSVFHQHFKSVTSTSPVQYLKAIRLHKARTLMIEEGIGASAAASRVGYESPSQFGREFKRFFGHSPMAGAVRGKLASALDD